MIVALFLRLGACAEGIGLLVAATVLCCCDISFRMIVNLSKLLRVAQISGHGAKQLNCWTAAITKKHRNIYERTYPTILVQPDGSSINVQYYEPRKILTLPPDLSALTDAERKARLERRKPKSKVTITQEIDDNFDESRYFKFPKKR